MSSYPPGPPYPPQGPYPPQQPPYFPPPAYPPPGYPPQQGYPPPGYAPPPQQGYPPPGYPGHQGYPPQQLPGGQPIVIPLVGTGAAKIAKLAGRNVVVTPDGFAISSKKAGWQVAWAELRELRILTAYHQNPYAIASPKTWRVRLVLNALDPSFLQRHPDFAKAEGKSGATGPGSFGVALGPLENVVPALAHAFGLYGGGVFTGVVEEGRVNGFGYT